MANFLLSLFLWFSFDVNTSNFQFVEEKIWIKGLMNFQLGETPFDSFSTITFGQGGKICASGDDLANSSGEIVLITR